MVNIAEICYNHGNIIRKGRIFMGECKVISVINWKGGVGKTTLTHHLATGLIHLSEEERVKYLGSSDIPRVLMVDTDAQCSLSIACLEISNFEDLVYRKSLMTILHLFKPFVERDEPGLNVQEYIMTWQVRSGNNSNYPTVHLIPSHQDLIFTDMDIAVFRRASAFENGDLYKSQALERILQQVKDDYDFIFIDCPPNLNYLTQNAIYASDYYLVPTLLDTLSSYGLFSLNRKVNELNDWWSRMNPKYRPTRLLGIVPNNVREYSQEPRKSQKLILEGLYEAHGDQVFQNYVTDGDGISRASQVGQPVYSIMSSDKKARQQGEQMMAVLEEALERLRLDSLG